MEPSISAFAIYVGLKTDLSKVLKDRCAIWNFFTYDIERCYGNPEHNITAKKMDYFVCTFPSMHDVSLASPGKSTMGIFICAPYKDEVFWNRFKIPLTDRLIDSVVKLIPEIKDGIDVKVIATPYTFYKYTLNRNGAIYGWASTPTQIDRTLFPQDTDIEGLFLAGHWCTNGLGQGGISEVAYTGRRAAKLIMKDFTKKKELSSVLL
jgi:prolycopene isomerase